VVDDDTSSHGQQRHKGGSFSSTTLVTQASRAYLVAAIIWLGLAFLPWWPGPIALGLRYVLIVTVGLAFMWWGRELLLGVAILTPVAAGVGYAQGFLVDALLFSPASGAIGLLEILGAVLFVGAVLVQLLRGARWLAVAALVVFAAVVAMLGVGAVLAVGVASVWSTGALGLTQISLQPLGMQAPLMAAAIMIVDAVFRRLGLAGASASGAAPVYTEEEA
jgi:hypothetical protein